MNILNPDKWSTTVWRVLIGVFFLIMLAFLVYVYYLVWNGINVREAFSEIGSWLLAGATYCLGFVWIMVGRKDNNYWRGFLVVLGIILYVLIGSLK